MIAESENPRTYCLVYVALLILLAITVTAASIEHRAIGVAVALTIAIIKAVLIALIFMQLRHATPVVRVFVVAGIVWLSFLLMLTAADYLTRA